MSILSNQRTEERKKALEDLSSLKLIMNNCIVIHYSCESFYQLMRTPRVTAICLLNKLSNSTSTFSISLQAQIQGFDLHTLTINDFDLLERAMLDRFYDYVNRYDNFTWIHWNMRNSMYGFDAIADRYRILGGTPIDIDQRFRFDLNNLMFRLFTNKFEENGTKGHMLHLADRNKITVTNALTGRDEANAFDNREYQRLAMSTTRKVEKISRILEATLNTNLKVKTPLYQIYGFTAPGIIEMVKNSKILSALYAVLLFIMGVLLEDPIKNVFSVIKLFISK